MYSILFNLFFAFVLGAIVGIERQWRQLHTGLTTHALVALGAATYSCLSIIVGAGSDVRIGGQVVTGIGFLGAGLIMRDGLNVRGLNTAATVWATGAIGVLCGYGFFLEAAESTALLLFINIAFPRLGAIVDRYAPANDEIERYYSIELRCDVTNEVMVRKLLLDAMNERKFKLHSLESKVIEDDKSVEVDAVIYSARQKDQLVEALVGELSLSPSIFLSRWTSTTPPE
ncbi:Protein MgtC OS=Afipia felis OX=1035 GN=BN961_03739 PE=3 SV=1 [Afipia felis]